MLGWLRVEKRGPSSVLARLGSLRLPATSSHHAGWVPPLLGHTGTSRRLRLSISLFGHAPEVQVSRWGLPMVTHLFLDDPSDQEVKEQFNASVPSEDLAKHI
jgi:hypothetical protein